MECHGCSRLEKSFAPASLEDCEWLSSTNGISALCSLIRQHTSLLASPMRNGRTKLRSRSLQQAAGAQLVCSTCSRETLGLGQLLQLLLQRLPDHQAQQSKEEDAGQGSHSNQKLTRHARTQLELARRSRDLCQLVFVLSLLRSSRWPRFRRSCGFDGRSSRARCDGLLWSFRTRCQCPRRHLGFRQERLYTAMSCASFRKWPGSFRVSFSSSSPGSKRNCCHSGLQRHSPFPVQQK